MTYIAVEGLILVSSMTERSVTDGSKEADIGVANAQVKAAPGSRKRKAAPTKDDGQVSQALRTVYQRAVDEDIPSEMLDLLSKLD